MKTLRYRWSTIVVRKTFTYSLLTLLLIFSAPVFSLGLGEIEVDSALNQPLNAKINLISTRAEDLEGLRVELAPAEVFDRVGVPRPFFLTQMKFEPLLSPGGGGTIRVTSKEPVREPFLTFLVEVSWPKGRLLREYTVLLDPPEFAQQQAPQISTPAVVTETPAPAVQEVVEVEPTPEPIPEPAVVAVEPVAPVAPQVTSSEQDIEEVRAEIDRRLGLDESTEPLATEVEEVAPTAEEIEVTVAEEVVEEADVVEELIEVEPIAVNENQADDVIIPEDVPGAETSSAEPIEEVSPGITSNEYQTTKGDTLYSVAEKAGVSPEHSIGQMMLAIQQANPDAFLRNNINLLKSGVVLRIPDDASVGSTSNSDAKKEIARQTNLWREYRQQVTDKIVATNVDAPDLVEESGTDTTAANEPQTEQSDTTKQATEQELTILAGDEKQSEEGAQNANEAIAKLQSELSLSSELAQSKGKENDELKSRIEALESILEKKEKIINIQNDQLDQLQDKLSSDAEVAATAEKQLKELQQQLKDAETTAATTAAAAAAAAAATEVETPKVEEPEVEQQVAKVEQVIAKPKLEPLPDWDSLPEIQPIEEPVTEVEQTAEVEPAVELPTETETTAEVTPEITPEVTPENVVETPVSTTSDSGIMAMLKKNWQFALGVPAALLAMILGFFALRQRRAANEIETVDLGSIPTEALDDEYDDILDETIVTPQGVSNDNSNAFQEDVNAVAGDDGLESSQDLEALGEQSSDTTPDDVIEEADVYISYGLHQQAEDLLKESIQNEPDRQDYKVKLAEVYYSQKNEQAFQGYAESIKDQLGESSNEWQSVISMGKQIAPASALFAGAAAVGVAAASSAKPVSADIDLGLDAAMSDPMSDDELEDTVLDNDEADDGGLDFDVEETITDDLAEDFEDDPVASKIMEANETSDILNFDIDDLADELEEGEEDLQASQTGIMEAVDFDETAIEEASTEEVNIDTALEESAEEVNVDTEVSADLDEVGMHTTMDDLKPLEMDEAVLDNTVALTPDELGTDLIDTAAAEAEETMAYKASPDDMTALDAENEATAAYQASETDVRSSTDLRSDLEDLNVDLDATAQLDVDQMDTAFLDVNENAINQTATDLHELGPPSLIEEVGTKLDLAKAFADMGDSDAAKETLLEVINEGDESQIVAAKDLMDKLGS